MKKYLGFVLATVFLATALLVAPMHPVSAQDEESIAETEDTSSRGPGAVIIMIGLAAIVVVGSAYAMRQQNGSEA